MAQQRPDSAQMRNGVIENETISHKEARRIVAERGLPLPNEGLVGSRVLIAGLVGRPELNGCSGEVKSYDHDKERFGVATTHGRVSIKQSNLSFVADEMPDENKNAKERARVLSLLISAKNFSGAARRLHSRREGLLHRTELYVRWQQQPRRSWRAG